MIEVIVRNIGSVYKGREYAVANELFETYVDYSKHNYGLAGGEDVTLFEDGRIVKEYNGTGDMSQTEVV